MCENNNNKNNMSDKAVVEFCGVPRDNMNAETPLTTTVQTQNTADFRSRMTLTLTMKRTISRSTPASYPSFVFGSSPKYSESMNDSNLICRLFR